LQEEPRRGRLGLTGAGCRWDKLLALLKQELRAVTAAAAATDSLLVLLLL
jgi:hypothetical protein